eukprot:11798913-Heterocapsa_arctica.AAC.1
MDEPPATRRDCITLFVRNARHASNYWTARSNLNGNAARTLRMTMNDRRPLSDRRAARLIATVLLDCAPTRGFWMNERASLASCSPALPCTNLMP